MRLTLTDSEVRDVLLAAAESKIGNIMTANPDNAWFYITNADGEVNDIEDVAFVVDFG